MVCVSSSWRGLAPPSTSLQLTTRQDVNGHDGVAAPRGKLEIYFPAKPYITMSLLIFRVALRRHAVRSRRCASRGQIDG